jgi:hypothetical protein
VNFQRISSYLKSIKRTSILRDAKYNKMQRSYILAHDMSFSCGDSRIYFWSFVNSSSGTLFEESQVDRIHWASDGGELI